MYIYMPHWPKPLGKRPINYNLGNIYEILNRLGNPQKNIPPVIHVAGTNGKGSTIAFMKQILTESGYKVHVYNSPHLVYFNERITLANEYISSSYLYNILEECRAVADDMHITFFEGTTAAAFLAFSKVKADIVILETGLGGRLDATNVIEEPLLTVITPISFDHQEILGNSIAAIALEKAGIIKQNCTCIISEQKEEARHVLEEIAKKQRAPVYRQNFEWSCNRKEDIMNFITGGEMVSLPLPSLPGEHQIINAGNAIAALTILANKYNYNISYESLIAGLQNTSWLARLQKITSGKLIEILPKSCQVFLDGAHNLAGAQALVKWAKKPIHCILGMTQGRNTVDFINTLKPIIKSLSCLCIQSEPKSQSVEEIYQAACTLKVPAIKCDSLTAALQNIAHKITDQDEQVLICGSLFLAGDVLKESSILATPDEDI